MESGRQTTGVGRAEEAVWHFARIGDEGSSPGGPFDSDGEEGVCVVAGFTMVDWGD